MATDESYARSEHGSRADGGIAAFVNAHIYWSIFLLAFVCAGVPRLVVFPLSVVHWDESIYTLVARDLTRGIIPLSGTFEHKPVALYYIYALPQWFLGESVAAIRLLSMAIGIAGATLFGILVRLTVTRDAAIVLTGTITYAFFSSLNKGLAAQPELIMNIVFMAVLVVLHFQFRTPEQKTRNSILIGVLWGVAFQANYLSGFLILGFVFDYIFLLHRSKSLAEATRAFLTGGLVIFASFSATVFALLLPVMVWGDISEYFYLQKTFLTGYTLERSWIETILQIPKVIDSYFLLVSLVATFVLFYSFHFFRKKEDIFFLFSDLSTRIIIYLPFVFVAIVASKRVYAKYYLQLLPLSILLLCLLLCSVTPKKYVRAFVCLWMVLFSAVSLDNERFIFKAGADGWAKVFDGRAPDVPSEIAKDISGLLSENDTIYVYDYQMILYHLSKVLPPTRFASPVHHLEEGYQKAMGIDPSVEMTKIMEHRPRFVITGSDPRTGEFGTASKILAEKLGSDYVPFRTYDDRIFYETLRANNNGRVEVFVLK
ncbi:ArnT family glycosyltransferase [Ensifer adhaerens]|uniref:ArnT family glycosyltransferase n=1 Tax=Ensifer adhaerens TaxID=106592 RepID=UPI003CFBD2F7